MSNANAPLRELPGWRIQLLPWVESHLHICKYALLSTSINGLTRYSLCAGETSDKQDFEAFIGPQKVKEFKHLFSRWIHTIYRKLLSMICVYSCSLVCCSSYV